MGRIKVEFHCHTHFSGDSLAAPERILAVCRRKGIGRIVITDHNTIGGALAAQALDPERVIIGEEILTNQGELLAAFVRAEIPKGLPALEAIAELRRQGAFISVSHPFDRNRSGHWKREDLIQIAPLVDAIETFNARCISQRFNESADHFARAAGLAGTAGSDAHAPFEIGRAVMEMSVFDGADGFRESLTSAKFQVKRSSPLVHLVSRYAAFVKGFQRIR